MKFIEKIQSSKKPLLSFELLPPLKGHNLDRIYAAIDPLLEYQPAAVNLTYHQEEILYKEQEDGTIKKISVRKRPGTVAISAAIKYKYQAHNLTVIPHLICGGFSKKETEYALIDLNFLGITDILVLRGDPLKTQRFFTPDKEGHAHAVDLVRQISNMNNGRHIDDQKTHSPSDFSVGVAGYPEKHYEAPNLDTDLKYLKAKVDAGADYIVTQMFFDNSKFFQFVDRCRAIGIEVPIVPGMKPIMTLRDAQVLPRIFSIDLPEALTHELNQCKTNEAAWQVGIDWAIMQSKELNAKGAPALHYYTYGSSENVCRIAKAVF